MSPPHENVLLVPDRNVLLTGSGWESAGTGSSNHDPARQRPPGGAQKACKGLITQRQAAAELDLTDRQVRRLLVRMKEVGDRAAMHGLRGRPSNRKLREDVRSKAIATLSQEVYRGFGPTLTSEYLAKKHKLVIGREALRQLMIGAGLWRSRRQTVETIHEWRPRRYSRTLNT
jgi:hypothetical protein